MGSKTLERGLCSGSNSYSEKGPKKSELGKLNSSGSVSHEVKLPGILPSCTSCKNTEQLCTYAPFARPAAYFVCRTLGLSGERWASYRLGSRDGLRRI